MYIAFGRTVVDTEEVISKIEKETHFKVLKDMSKGTRREDTTAYNLSISVDVLNQILEDSFDDIDSLTEDELFNEYMDLAEELGSYLAELFDDEGIFDCKAYKWDRSDNDIRLVIAVIHEDLGEGKLMDIMKRLLKQVE